MFFEYNIYIYIHLIYYTLSLKIHWELQLPRGNPSGANGDPARPGEPRGCTGNGLHLIEIDMETTQNCSIQISNHPIAILWWNCLQPPTLSPAFFNILTAAWNVWYRNTREDPGFSARNVPSIQATRSRMRLILDSQNQIGLGNLSSPRASHGKRFNHIEDH